MIARLIISNFHVHFSNPAIDALFFGLFFRFLSTDQEVMRRIYIGWAKSRYTVTFLCALNCPAVHFLLLVKYHQQLDTKPNFYELFFQQDGAPPHYALRVRDYLNEVFLQRWFGRRGSIEWPPRSPDLTKWISFFGCCKEQGVWEEPQNNKWIKRLHSWRIQRHWSRPKFVPHCVSECFGQVWRMLQCWWRTFWALKRLNSFCVRYN